MIIGDCVRIVSKSEIVRVDKFEMPPSVNTSARHVVIRLKASSDPLKKNKDIVHDIFIRNEVTGEIYLHSSSYVQPWEVTYVKSAVDIMKALIDDGYQPAADGTWYNPKSSISFTNTMWQYCGKPLVFTGCTWLKKWLEVK